jgi:rRNA processing protein Krr1/Pno1
MIPMEEPISDIIREIITVFVRINTEYIHILGPYREVYISSAGQIVLRVLWNRKVHYRLHKSSLLASIPRKAKPVHTPSILFV